VTLEGWWPVNWNTGTWGSSGGATNGTRHAGECASARKDGSAIQPFSQWAWGIGHGCAALASHRVSCSPARARLMCNRTLTNVTRGVPGHL